MADLSPSSFRVSLADALGAGMPPTWPEAVAIIRQLTSVLERGAPPVIVPSLTQVHVLASGELVVSGGQPDPASAAAGVGQLLGHLINQSHPPAPLVDVQRRAVASPPAFDSLSELANALGFFARPDPEGELAAFYARVAPVVEARVRDSALTELQEKARGIEPPSKARPAPDRRTVKQVAALAILLAGIGLLWLSRPVINRWLASPSGAPARSALDTISTAASAARDAASAIIGSSPAASTDAAPATVPDASAPPAPTGRRTARRAPSAPSGAGRSATLAPDGSSTDAGRESAAPSAPIELLAPLPDAGIYSSSSAEVQPPSLVHPQMPSRRVGGHPAERPGELELLVLEDGTVSEARLIPASNRLQDRMLISAAKAWRFQPASRQGQPVRYRLRVPITW